MKKDLSTEPYEKLYEELEEIVLSLEHGDLPLEKAIKRYERGMMLYRECQKRLKDAEERLLQISKNEDGVALTKLELSEYEEP